MVKKLIRLSSIYGKVSGKFGMDSKLHKTDNSAKNIVRKPQAI